LKILCDVIAAASQAQPDSVPDSDAELAMSQQTLSQSSQALANSRPFFIREFVAANAKSNDKQFFYGIVKDLDDTTPLIEFLDGESHTKPTNVCHVKLVRADGELFEVGDQAWVLAVKDEAPWAGRVISVDVKKRKYKLKFLGDSHQ
jgi:hypothetical protein